MALSAKVGTINCPGSAGSQAVTGVGFQPTALILWTAAVTSDNATAAGLKQGFGVASGSGAQYAIGIGADDNVGTSVTYRTVANADIIMVPATSSTYALRAALASFDSDGFTLTWANVTSGARVHYLALGGASLTGAKAGVFQKISGTGSQAVTGVGFQPSALLTMSTIINSIPSITSTLSMSLGATDGTDQWTVGEVSSTGSAASAAVRRFYTSQVSAALAGAGTPNALASLTSFDVDGFTVNWGTGTAFQQYIPYLALGGVSVDVGTITQKTSTGSQATTGVGFKPAALMLVSHGSTTTGASTINDYLLTIGAGSSATQRATVWGGDNNAADPMQSDSQSSISTVISIYDPGTPTLLSEADLTSLDSDGWTLNWTTADATARVIGYIAFGPAVTATTLAMPVTTASGAAIAPGARVSPQGTLLSATSLALAPGVLVRIGGTLSSSSGVIFAPGVIVSPQATLLTASSLALAPGVWVRIPATLSTATGAFITPSFSIGPISLAASLSTASALALAPNVMVVIPGALSTGSGLVRVPGIRLSIPGSLSSASSLAQTPAVRIGISAPLSLASALVLAPGVSASIPGSLLLGSGALVAPSVRVGIAAPVLPASADVLLLSLGMSLALPLLSATALAIPPLVYYPPLSLFLPTLEATGDILIPRARAYQAFSIDGPFSWIPTVLMDVSAFPAIGRASSSSASISVNVSASPTVLVGLTAVPEEAI